LYFVAVAFDNLQLQKGNEWMNEHILSFLCVIKFMVQLCP